MKRIAMATVLLAASAAGVGYAAYPDESTLYLGVAAKAGLRVWDNVEANPVPVFLALGTFLLTVLYHKARGKSLRESVEVAATRVTVVSSPARDPSEEENPVVRRAKARTTRTQLTSDLIGLQNRYRKLPEEIQRLEKEVCYTEQALDEAEAKLTDKQRAHEVAVTKLEAVRREKAESDAEMAAIEFELKKLADVA
ncbi:MAG: hypothetical protein C0467_08775 [Planctomycetaceae bacterium]|nr:hypothetical protein [Planctomycetaceae bacterium]